MVEVSNRLALGGLVATAVAMTSGVLLAADVMFGSGVGVAIAVATAVAFIVVWDRVPAAPAARRSIGARRPRGRA